MEWKKEKKRKKKNTIFAHHRIATVSTDVSCFISSRTKVDEIDVEKQVCALNKIKFNIIEWKVYCTSVFGHQLPHTYRSYWWLRTIFTLIVHPNQIYFCGGKRERWKCSLQTVPTNGIQNKHLHCLWIIWWTSTAPKNRSYRLRFISGFVLYYEMTIRFLQCRRHTEMAV